MDRVLISGKNNAKETLENAAKCGQKRMEAVKKSPEFGILIKPNIGGSNGSQGEFYDDENQTGHRGRSSPVSKSDPLTIDA